MNFSLLCFTHTTYHLLFANEPLRISKFLIWYTFNLIYSNANKYFYLARMLILYTSYVLSLLLLIKKPYILLC